MTYIKATYSFLKKGLVAILLLGPVFLTAERVHSAGARVIEELHSNLSKVFPTDWEIIPIGANSYKIIIGKRALDELAQLAEEKIKEEKEKASINPTISPFVERVNEGLEKLPDFKGTITGSIKIVFTPPVELQQYFSDIRDITKEAHLHLVKSANSANWILETGYSTLPDKETVLSVIEQVNDAIKENKDLALYIKGTIPEGWDLSRIDVQKVVIVLHFKE